jgi:L-ascorbate metabolism protein UlaG (beta-lactamase superfamily)
MTDRNPAGRLLAAAVLVLGFLPSLAAAAAAPTSPRCPGPVAALPPAVPAAFDLAALSENEVRLTFIGHATFLIESPHGVRIATDYNDAVALPILPDIVTMNHAHPTHYSNHPDPGIKVVLRGWNDDGSPAVRDLAYGDVRVRNVPTNIRDGAGATERYGNSVFIFAMASLCIVHLGHLHHTLTPDQLAAIGPVDVVMAPVDGIYTLDLAGMIEVLQALKATLMLPMHFFGAFGLQQFLSLARPHWPVEINPTPSVVISRTRLPPSPTVLVLPGP